MKRKQLKKIVFVLLLVLLFIPLFYLVLPKYSFLRGGQLRCNRVIGNCSIWEGDHWRKIGEERGKISSITPSEIKDIIKDKEEKTLTPWKDEKKRGLYPWRE